MKIDDFLAKLQGVTSDGKGGYMACCPAHDDHNPSMHVNVGDDGRILVKCFAGCTTDDIVSAMGLKKKDLMSEASGHKGPRKAPAAKSDGPAAITPEDILTPMPVAAAPKKPRDRGKLVCEYVYKNEDGAAVFKVQRRMMANGKKTFVQMSSDPDSPGGWTFGVASKGVEYIPYQLPLVRMAAKGGKPVIIVEGEKDVCTMIKRLHLAATCNAKGAGKWQAGWGKYFEGVPSILIIADKDPDTRADEKTGEEKPFAVGQRHACDVERKLRADGFQGKIRKIVMPDVEVEQGVLKHVKDFTDWVEAMDAAHRTVDKSSFKEAIDSAGEWPEKWSFAGDDLVDLQRAQKEARKSASSSDAAPDEGGENAEEKDARVRIGAAGRFGAPSPRTPSDKERRFLVDFQIKAGKIARFEIGIGSIEFEAWERGDEDGDGDDELQGRDGQEYRRMKHFSAIRCALPDFIPLAIGSIKAWEDAFKMANADRIALTSVFALAWLRARGQFFADKNNPCYETSLFFDNAKGILYRLHSNEFSSFLATMSNVNREDKTFKFMMSLIDDFAMDDKQTPRVVPSKEWDRAKDGGPIYISNGDSRICKISAGKIEDVPNGTDGVVFVRGATLDPWTLHDGTGEDPFTESLLFKHASLESESDRMNCRLWFLNLFACHTNKPILLVTGPARSGKTRLLQGMKQFLGIREDGKLDDTVTSIDPTDKGLDSFWVIVDRGRFEIFDNYDAKIKWAENEFQTAATNGSVKRRELYKTSNLVTLSANSYIGVTSNNPIFTTEGGGLPDRIITVRVGGGRKVSLGGELLKNIQDHRDEYMTWLVRVLAAVLADVKPVDESINKRHPDYGIFSTKCGRAIGDESGAIRAMEAAELEKALLPLQNDTITKEVMAVLLDQEKIGSSRFTASEMSDMIIKRLGDDETDEKTKTIFGARRIGKAINKLSREFSTLFKWSSGTFEGRTRYEFTGLTAAGEVVFDRSHGGNGGLKTAFSENFSQSAGARDDFSGNSIFNPPNPPDTLHARAQAHDVFSSNIEGDSIKDLGRGGGEANDGDWEFDL